jgi:hypothetical protein
MKRLRSKILAALALAAGLVATAHVWQPGWLDALAGRDEVRELIEEIEAGKRPSGWILPASVELREDASERAPSRATLERATPVVVREEAGAWTRVQVYGAELEGWVRSDAIGTAREAIPELPSP